MSRSFPFRIRFLRSVPGLVLLAGCLMSLMGFRALASPPADELQKIVVLGDSITKGVRTGVPAETIFSARLQQLLTEKGMKCGVVNLGIGGERTDQALRRLTTDVVALKPSIVTVMYGTNDSYVDKGQTSSRITADEFEANLEKIVTELQAAKIRVILMTEPRWGDQAGLNGAGEHPNLRLELFMMRTRAVAQRHKLELIDHYQIWSDAREKGASLSDWMTDECHPNPDGHRQMTESILPVLIQAVK